MKKRYLLILIMLFAIVLLTHKSIIAYLFDEDERKGETTIGLVDVEYDIYFMHEGVEKEATYVEIDSKNQVEKTGIFRANAVSPSDQNFITKLKIDIRILSNVDSYIRIKMSPSIVLTQQGIGQETSNSIVMEQTLFEAASKWHGFRNDQLQYHYYYEDAVKKENGELVIPFIIEMPSFKALNPGYSIEIKLELEAVQALNGPQKNWFLEEKPWENGGSWS